MTEFNAQRFDVMVVSHEVRLTMQWIPEYVNQGRNVFSGATMSEVESQVPSILAAVTDLTEHVIIVHRQGSCAECEGKNVACPHLGKTLPCICRSIEEKRR